MKKHLKLGVAVCVTQFSIGLPVAHAGPPKVDVCHGKGLINISERALAAHLAHGDALPGDPVPGQADYIYDESCNPIEPPCVSSLAPGAHQRTLSWEGANSDGEIVIQDRPYEIYIPESVGDTPAPLVFSLHPYIFGGHPVMQAGWARESQYKKTADENGFIVVQPNGTGSPLTSWNGGEECCSPASDTPARPILGTPAVPGVDDIGFLQALADQVATETCIDPSRIYATGMSNGGYLSHRLACEAPGFIAAIAPVVGSFSEELVCTTQRGIPVLQVSGAEDSLPSREESVERWKSLNQCNDDEGVATEIGEATCTTWTGCTDGVEVTHCVLPERGHCWFSDLDRQLTPGCPATEEVMNDDGELRIFNSHDVTWDFLSRWTLPSIIE